MGYTKISEEKASKTYNEGVAYFHGEKHPWFNPYGIQDYEKALNCFMSVVIVNSGSDDEIAEAYNYIGVIYQNGLCVNEDKEKAFEAFKAASEMGSWRGTEHLASKYYWGDGVAQDIEMAMNYFYIAWQNGTPSQNNIELIKEEADKGNKDAQWCLGETIYSSYHSSIPDDDFIAIYRFYLFWYTIPEIKEYVKLLQNSAKQGQKFAMKFYQSLNISKRTVLSIIILIFLLLAIIFIISFSL